MQIIVSDKVFRRATDLIPDCDSVSFRNRYNIKDYTGIPVPWPADSAAAVEGFKWIVEFSSEADLTYFLLRFS